MEVTRTRRSTSSSPSDGGSVVVDVTDKDDIVHVSAPIRAIASTIEQVAAASAETQELNRGGFPYWRAQRGPSHAPVRIGDFLAEPSKLLRGDFFA